MEIYLFRHGIADDGRPGDPDSARQLTPDGRRKTAAVIRMAREAGVQPSLILSSPYIRARQTAHIAAQESGCTGEVLTIDSLVPHGRPEDVWADIRDHSDEPSVLLAGHEPLLSHLAAWLLNAPQLRIDMKKSALIRIDADSIGAHPHGILRWMAIPKLVEKS